MGGCKSRNTVPVFPRGCGGNGRQRGHQHGRLTVHRHRRHHRGRCPLERKGLRQRKYQSWPVRGEESGKTTLVRPTREKKRAVEREREKNLDAVAASLRGQSAERPLRDSKRPARFLDRCRTQTKFLPCLRQRPVEVRLEQLIPAPPCSLRAEAAAMLELLLRAPPDQPLTVLCDSLSLLLLLKNYHRCDFRFQPFQHRQANLLEQILDLLCRRTHPTKLVKVKLHTGILSPH
eukprot:3219516-Rhodomonas_salina.1